MALLHSVSLIAVGCRFGETNTESALVPSGGGMLVHHVLDYAYGGRGAGVFVRISALCSLLEGDQ